MNKIKIRLRHDALKKEVENASYKSGKGEARGKYQQADKIQFEKALKELKEFEEKYRCYEK